MAVEFPEKKPVLAKLPQAQSGKKKKKKRKSSENSELQGKFSEVVFLMK